MRIARPQWFPVMDVVTVAVALLVTTLILFVTMIIWIH